MNDPFGDTRLSHSGDGPGQIRLWPVATIVVAIFLLFVVRLFQLQILEGEALASRSQANYVRTVRLEAQRGTIVDREGRTIAASRLAYGVDLIPNEIRNPWRTYSVLGTILRQDPSEISKRVGQPRGRRRFQAVNLSKDLSIEAQAQVAAHRYAMPGVELYRKPLRDYVYGPLAAQLLGTIGEVDAEELGEDAYKDYRPGETIGKTGIEAANEGHLRGRTGGVNLVVDVAGREIEEIETGDRITGTLERDGPDVFHSRLSVSPGGRWLMSAGWVWHPVDVVYVYDLAEAIREPATLDKEGLSPPGAWEMSSASFSGPDAVVIGTSDEFYGDEDDSDDLRPGKNVIGMWEIGAASYSAAVSLEHPPGAIMALDDRFAICFFGHPRLIDFDQARTVHEWHEIDSGEQARSITWGKESPRIALDPQNARFAVADDECVRIVEIDLNALRS